MIIYYTPEQYQANEEFRALISMLNDNSGSPMWHDGISSVKIGDVGMLYVEPEYIQLCIDLGIRLEDARLYSPVIPATTLDNKVPSDWPNALKSDPEDPEKTVTKEWQEYTHVVEVDGGYVLRFCNAGMSANRNITWACSNEMLLKWVDKFGGFLTVPEVDAIKPVVEDES